MFTSMCKLHWKLGANKLLSSYIGYNSVYKKQEKGYVKKYTRKTL